LEGLKSESDSDLTAGRRAGAMKSLVQLQRRLRVAAQLAGHARRWCQTARRLAREAERRAKFGGELHEAANQYLAWGEGFSSEADRLLRQLRHSLAELGGG
jgi:hypothetical protein